MNLPSPCVARCALNRHQVCVGCYRTIEEIVNWKSLSDETQQEVIAELTTRKQQMKDDDGETTAIGRCHYLAFAKR